jgi:ubiquinone/menaquinone biosynthesis C-methylase UbiE
MVITLIIVGGLALYLTDTHKAGGFGPVDNLNNHSNEATAGAAVYYQPVLAIYDLFVLGFSNRFAWKVPTRSILGFYNAHVSTNHLDVGVGTGYFLDRCRFPSSNPTITLVDLNPNSLQAAAQRLRRYQPRAHLANVLAPLQIASPGFDSIGLSYLLHCLPGTMQDKGAVLQNLKLWLHEGGVIFGTTILGQGVPHNPLARVLMHLYNRQGIFSNARDNAGDLEGILQANFTRWSLRVAGCAAFFAAWTS